MQDFNFGVSYVLIVFNCRTHNDLKTVYIKFHLDKTHSYLFYLNHCYVIQIVYITIYLVCMKHCKTFH